MLNLLVRACVWHLLPPPPWRPRWPLQPQAAQAQTVAVSPGVWATRLPVALRAPATAAGEAVHFSGAGSITTRVSTDPTNGSKALLALVNTSGITGVGVSTGTRYVLTAQESLTLPHASVQNVTLSIPLEPAPGSPNQRIRVATVVLAFVIDMGTGAVVAVNSGGISVS